MSITYLNATTNVTLLNVTELADVVKALQENVKANANANANANETSDAIWVIISAFIIFTMQSGFGLLESGLVSHRNEANVMVKNCLDVSLGGIAFWMFGFGFGFGENDQGTGKMSGVTNFMWDELKLSTNREIDESMKYAQYFFQLSFATTATTIISGAVAERVRLKAYMLFAIIFTGFVYPFPAHWLWHGDGWLAQLGAYDFAGSSVVHMSGGAAAFAASAILGPRERRFGKNAKEYLMAAPTNVVLGTFFLWWGWIGFNCGSTFMMSGGAWKIASRTAVVTMNGAMGGGLSAVLMNLVVKGFKRREYLLDIPQLVSGILGGLVGITAPASVIEPWEGLIIGLIGGLIANGAIELVDKMQVDDPVGCVGVHWAAGAWAMIATGLFAKKAEGDLGYAPEHGIFRGGGGTLLGANIAAIVCVTLWSGGLTAIIFLIMKYTVGIRMGIEKEKIGSDMIEHNIPRDAGGGMRKRSVIGARVPSQMDIHGIIPLEQVHVNPITEDVTTNGTA